MSLYETTGPLSPELEAKLLDPYTYTLQKSGKQFRSKLMEAFNYWLALPQEKLEMIGSLVEMLHNASLLIDDIQDNSRLRRGAPVAHLIYGAPLTINAANSVYFLALERLLESFPADARSAGVRIFTQQIRLLHQGQGLDIYWRDAFLCPTEQAYLDMAARKTGALFVLLIRLMQLYSEDRRDYGSLLKHLGMYFQIRDDYSNLTSKKYEEGKGFADDLTEGKFSFPIIHAIRQSPDDQALLNILKQRTENVELKKVAVSRLEEAGSLAYTAKVMSQLYEKIADEIEALGGNATLKGLLEYLKEQQA